MSTVFEEVRIDVEQNKLSVASNEMHKHILQTLFVDFLREATKKIFP